MTPPILIDLVEHAPGQSATGIGRYAVTLYQKLMQHPQQVDPRLTTTAQGAFAQRLSIFSHFPTGVSARRAGSIVHFMQIMGCSQMVWRPLHPAIGTIHDLGVLVCPEDATFIKPLDRALLSLHLAGLRRLDAWIADSVATARDAVEHLRVPPERVHTIYPGVDLSLYRPVENAYAHLPEAVRFKTDRHRFYLLYVGNEFPRKNLNNLLRALKILKDKGYAPRLIKVGGAGGEAHRAVFLRQIQDLRLADDVLILGRVDEALLPLIYSAVDVFVTVSVMEGFGYPLVEALACGAPAVAAQIGSLPEVGGAAPRWIEQPRDPAVIADRLAAVLDAPETWAAMRARGIAQAAQFTFERFSVQMIEVYQSIR